MEIERLIPVLYILDFEASELFFHNHDCSLLHTKSHDYELGNGCESPCHELSYLMDGR